MLPWVAASLPRALSPLSVPPVSSGPAFLSVATAIARAPRRRCAGSATRAAARDTHCILAGGGGGGGVSRARRSGEGGGRGESRARRTGKGKESEAASRAHSGTSARERTPPPPPKPPNPRPTPAPTSPPPHARASQTAAAELSRARARATRNPSFPTSDLRNPPCHFTCQIPFHPPFWIPHESAACAVAFRRRPTAAAEISDSYLIRDLRRPGQPGGGTLPTGSARGGLKKKKKRAARQAKSHLERGCGTSCAENK